MCDMHLASFKVLFPHPRIFTKKAIFFSENYSETVVKALVKISGFDAISKTCYSIIEVDRLH